MQLFSALDDQIDQKIGTEVHSIDMQGTMRAFFDFSIFCHFMADFWLNFGKFRGSGPKFTQKSAIK